jgi:hypothetical protein
VIVNDTPLPLVCFTHERIRSGEISTGEVVGRVLASRRAWISEVVLGERERTLRACITSHRTEPADLDVLLAELEGALHPAGAPGLAEGGAGPL